MNPAAGTVDAEIKIPINLHILFLLPYEFKEKSVSLHFGLFL